MHRKMKRLVLGALGVGLLLTACGGGQKKDAEDAINAAQTAITAAQDEAAKYVPDQLKAAQDSLQSAKDALAKGDYQAALTAAQDASTKAKDLPAAAAAKKDELTKEWASLSESVPKSLETVKKKLDAYSHGAKLPAGMDKAKLADDKAQYTQLQQSWSDASASYQQGNLLDAVNKASAANDGLTKLKEPLGIKS